MTLKRAILQTLTYHNIFSYPLKKEEIHRYLIEKEASLKSIENELKSLLSRRKLKKDESSTLYALPHFSNNLKLRKTREKYSKEKLKRAYFYSTILTLIPTIKTIALSGALAMQNSHKDDDIDFVIVTSKNTLWTTRFLATLLLFPFKRKPGSEHVSNKACLNLFLDESDLKIKQQNLYSAHELAQMKLMYDKDKTYNKLIKSNQWIFKYLPNWTPEAYAGTKGDNQPQASSSPVEELFKRFQLFYMKKKRSTETIGEKQLFFHPRDTEKQILQEYRKRIRNLTR